MKNFIYFYVGFILLAMNTLNAQYVTLEDKQFWLNGETFYPLMTNYTVGTVHDPDSNQFYVTPFFQYDSTLQHECTCKDSCASQMQRDFNYIAGMGFNGIRFYSFYPHYKDSALVFYFISLNLGVIDSLILDTDNPADTNMRKVFNLYDQLLCLANNTVNPITEEPTPLKLIFNLIGRKSDFSEYERNLWDEYFDALSGHLDTAANNEAMLAYDLMNEPYHHVTEIKTKEEACDMIGTWYNTIKANDKKHLITIGSGGFKDVFSFDPSILKVDFYSLHYYPAWREAYEDRHYDSIQKLVRDRMVNDLYWMNNNSNRPWIVGETGLSASVNYTIDSGNMNGSLQDQANYVKHNLNAVPNCGASGFSWGGYQDVDNNDLGNDAFQSDYIGIIEKFHTPGPWSEKPAVDTFRYWNYVKDTCPVCYSTTYDTAKLYYNPYRHPTFDSTSFAYNRTGYIVDQDGDPVEDVFIESIEWMSSGDSTTNFKSVYDYNYTFSDENGYFKIIPYDYWDIRNDSAKVVIMTLSAAGSEVHIYNGNNIPANNSVYEIKMNPFLYNSQIKSISIDSGDYVEYNGFYNVSISDFTVNGYGNADIFAENKIHLKPGFSSLKNSQIRLYISDTAYSCSDFSWSKTLLKFINSFIENHRNPDIEVQFQLFDKNDCTSVFPNPTSGNFQVIVHSLGYDETYDYQIMDFFGNNVSSTQTSESPVYFDLTNYPKGIYVLKIKNDSSTICKKIIVK